MLVIESICVVSGLCSPSPPSRVISCCPPQRLLCPSSPAGQLRVLCVLSHPVLRTPDVWRALASQRLPQSQSSCPPFVSSPQPPNLTWEGLIRRTNRAPFPCYGSPSSTCPVLVMWVTSSSGWKLRHDTGSASPHGQGERPYLAPHASSQVPNCLASLLPDILSGTNWRVKKGKNYLTQRDIFSVHQAHLEVLGGRVLQGHHCMSQFCLTWGHSCCVSVTAPVLLNVYV